MNYKEEYIKCYKDKSRQYFIENYLSTYNATERKEVPFKLFPRQIELIKAFGQYNNIITIKPRQSGITTVTSAFIAAQIVFASLNSPETVLCIGNKLDISQQLLEKMAEFLEQVPRWMWGSDYFSPDPNSPKNTKSIYKTRNKARLELFNGCKVYARSSGPNAARGISAASYLVIDECAFLQNGVTVYTQALATTNSVKDPHVILISTPNGKDPLYYQTYSKAIKKENNFHVVEFRWFQDPRYNRNLKWYRKNAKTGVVEWNCDTVVDKKGNIKYDETRWKRLEQEGWKPTSPWYENTCKSFNNDEIKINQELNVSFLGSSDNVVPVEVIEQQLKENVIEITDDWELKDTLVEETWIWKDPIPGHRYICAADPSSGAGDDFTAIQVIDVDAIDDNGMPFFEQVLEYNGKLNGNEVGQLIDRYGKVYNNALVVVEAIGGYGDSVALSLLELGYPNLYYDDPTLKNYTNENMAKFTNHKFDQKNRLPGFRSNALRLQMISNFVELIKENAFKIRSMRTINELETWVFKNGRPDHQDGAHDDLLTCLAMGLFIMQFYMIRKDKDKTKDAAMLKSWRVNKTDYLNSKTRELDNNMNVSPKQNKYNMPFYSSRSVDKKKQARFMAMLMIGGYNPHR